MFKRVIATTASAALALAAIPAFAQAAPVPAAESSLGAQGESRQFGENTVGYVLLAAFAIASVWALIEIVDDDDGDSVSP